MITELLLPAFLAAERTPRCQPSVAKVVRRSLGLAKAVMGDASIFRTDCAAVAVTVEDLAANLVRYCFLGELGFAEPNGANLKGKQDRRLR